MDNGHCGPCQSLVMKLTFLLSIMASTLQAQHADNLPYREIPDYPDHYKAGTVAARIIDGVGFRYYWASEGLRPKDLIYQPGEGARTTEETLFHLYELSINILNTAKKQPNEKEQVNSRLSYAELRAATLNNLKEASNRLKAHKEDSLEEFNLVYQGARGTATFPFWNLLNGPIADALWHIGQVVSQRRSSGNPLSNKANVLTGKVAKE